MLAPALQACGLSSSQEYNKIKLFEEQVHFLHSTILEALGELYVRHHAHIWYGVSILHRHHDLSPGNIWVHSNPDPNTDICSMVNQTSSAVTPSSFHLTPSYGFQPFEYDRRPDRPVPNEPFLAELNSFLSKHALGDTIAICGISSNKDDRWVESLRSNGTISHRVPEYQFRARYGVITGWRFNEGDRGVEYQAIAKCEELESGGHRATM